MLFCVCSHVYNECNAVFMSTVGVPYIHDNDPYNESLTARILEVLSVKHRKFSTVGGVVGL